MHKKVRVLIIDDSAFMRKAIKSMMADDPDIEVVGAARDGVEGVDLAMELSPDVVTLDVEMPRMNGLEALKIIMEKKPTHVLMLSSLTTEDAKATLDALDIGAVDYIPKNLDNLSFNIVRIKEDLLAKIKSVARRPIPKKRTTKAAEPVHYAQHIQPVVVPAKDKFVSGQIAIVGVGASTGGPKALQDILPYLPKDMPAGMLVVQHMPQAFTGPFAERMQGLSKIEVREAKHGDVIKPGLALIAPGGFQTRTVKKGVFDFYVEINDVPHDSIYKPCVDISLTSVANAYPGRCMGVILTGMGYDGREGMRAIKKSGGKTIAQDEATCVVYGMPKAVVDDGTADKVVPLESIAGEIVNMV